MAAQVIDFNSIKSGVFPRTLKRDEDIQSKTSIVKSVVDEYNINKTDLEVVASSDNDKENKTAKGIGLTGGGNMDWQEKYIDKLDRDLGEIKSSLRATEERIAGMVETSVNTLNQTVNQTLGEMRDRDNQRHQEFINISNKLDTINSNVSEKLGSQTKWVTRLVISTIVGIAAIIGTAFYTIAKIVTSTPK
jgi:hypothetical protein